MRILLFNPENDLALASNDAHYTPPASARRMAADLQDLPRLWARPQDIVLGRDDSSFVTNEPYGANLAYEDSSFILPWGWSPLLLTQLRAWGVPSEMLPTEEQMQRFRQLAGRATAQRVLERVRGRLEAEGFAGQLVGEAHCCRTLEEVAALHSMLGETLLKQPWSGSGRGLHPLHGGVVGEKDEAWVKRTLREQGYVMAEPIYNKVHDLAVECWCHEDGTVTYEGLSLFTTTAGGVYAGNLIAVEQEKRCRVAQWMSLPLLDAAVAALCQELTALDKGFYTGPIGIDMMTVNDKPSTINPHPSTLNDKPSTINPHPSTLNDKPSTINPHPSTKLHPCVEINFRMTMGWVALQLTDRLGDGQTGSFRIVHEDGHYRVEVKNC